MVTAEWIRSLIDKNELWKFYKTKEWRKLKEKVLRESHYECEDCRKRGIVTRYDTDEKTGERRRLSTVHHVNHVRTHPELALSEYYIQSGVRKKNLIAVCKSCHNKLHPEKFRKKYPEGFTNVERW